MLARSGLILAIGILLGRLLGFARELAIASRFGASGDADAAILTLTLPDLLMNVLFGSALAVVLVPEFVRLGERGAAVVHHRITAVGLLAGLVLAVFLVALADPVARWLAPGVSPSVTAEIAHGIAWSSWLIPLIIAALVTTVWLQALQRFQASAFSTVFYNGVLVAALWSGLPGGDPLATLALAMLAAGLVRCLWLWRDAWPFMNRQPPDVMDWSGLLRRYRDATLAGMAIFLFPLLGRALASVEGDGALSVYNYASKLVELPLAIAITMVSTVVFARLADEIQSGKDWLPLWRDCQRLILVLSAVIVLPSLCFGHPLADLAYGWGAMSPASRSAVASQWQVGMLSLALQGIYTLNNLVLATRRRTGFMMQVSYAGLAVFAVSGWLASRRWGGEGLMVALILAYGVMCGIQQHWLARQEGARLRLALDPSMLRLLAALALFSAPFAWAAGFVGRWGGLGAAGMQAMLLSGLSIVMLPEWRARLLTAVGRGKVES